MIVTRQGKLSDFELTSAKLNQEKLLRLAAEGIPAAQAARLLNVSRMYASRWFRKFQALSLLKMEGNHPKLPVLLVSVEQALDVLHSKRLLTTCNTIGEIPLDSTIHSCNTSDIVLAEDLETSARGGLRSARRVILREVPQATPFWSVHRLVVRFRLRGRLPSQADRHGKNGKSYWYLRGFEPEFKGVTIEGSSRSVLVKVFGVLRGSVVGVKLEALRLAAQAVQAWGARYGARLEAQGELVGAPHWVLEDKVLSNAVIRALNLDKQPRSIGLENGLAKWTTDKSHEGLVEVQGVGAELQVMAFERLVTGALDLKLNETRGALVSLGEKTGELAGEVRKIAEVLKPPSLPVMPEKDRDWRDAV